MEVKSTKLLFLYRSFLFKFTKFETKDKNLKEIVEALNIKNKKERIEYVYNEAIKVINKYYSKDLCKFKDNKCIAQRKQNRDDLNGCCPNFCLYSSNKGCRTCNIPCKLLYCKTALGNMKALKLRDIVILKTLPKGSIIILKTSYFNSKETILKDLYYGIIIYMLKYLYREFKLDLRMIKYKNK